VKRIHEDHFCGIGMATVMVAVFSTMTAAVVVAVVVVALSGVGATEPVLSSLRSVGGGECLGNERLQVMPWPLWPAADVAVLYDGSTHWFLDVGVDEAAEVVVLARKATIQPIRVILILQES